MTDPRYTNDRRFRDYYYQDAEVRVIQSSCVCSGDVGRKVYPVRIFGGIDPGGHVHLSLEQAQRVRDALTVYINESEGAGR